MTLSPAQKTAFGILSFVPALSAVISMAYWMNVMQRMLSRQMIQPSAMNNPQDLFQFINSEMMGTMKWMMLAGVLHLGILVLFILHILKNGRLQGSDRTVWMIVVILAGAVGFPVYYFMQVRKDKAPGGDYLVGEPSGL